LIKYLIQQITEDDFIVLYAFTGGGITGKTGLELNTEDGGHRNFILIEANYDLACTITKRRLS
jgi:adenine specific DNA methylase Mod